MREFGWGRLLSPASAGIGGALAALDALEIISTGAPYRNELPLFCYTPGRSLRVTRKADPGKKAARKRQGKARRAGRG